MDEAQKRVVSELTALGERRKAAEDVVADLSAQSKAVAIDALKQGIRPATVARSLQYTDGYVRKLAREAALPPDPRYADIRPPSRSKPTESASASTGANLRSTELLDMAAALTEPQRQRVAGRIREQHGVWVRTLWPFPRTDQDLIEAAIKANMVTAGDLRP